MHTGTKTKAQDSKTDEIVEGDTIAEVEMKLIELWESDE